MGEGPCKTNQPPLRAMVCHVKKTGRKHFQGEGTIHRCSNEQCSGDGEYTPDKGRRDEGPSGEGGHVPGSDINDVTEGRATLLTHIQTGSKIAKEHCVIINKLVPCH